MLRVSKLADYGTIIMVYLAKSANELYSARDIAAKTHLTLPTVSKLLKRLCASGLLLSVRGTHGGYRLAKSPQVISLSDIVHAIDEVKGLTECGGSDGVCALHDVCHVKENWQIISHMIESTLKSVTLEALTSRLQLGSRGHFVQEKLGG